eukprot:TRINITY_DN3186_c0_g1_i1.p2 TRINITY_DN3186_c0_g1~~TRINITY_DN3186_c0_g1_i1.p2  ORF type:complete len:147 (-),score=36.21 TRINITY_DN3186_c0_g1_i1:212-652(-)
MAAKYRERLAASSGVSSNRAFESDYGRRILLKYGWEDGQGLGRLCHGRTECLQATRREMNKGLGAEKRKAEDQWDNWWSDCFNSVAQKIKVETSSSAGIEAESGSSDEEDDKVPAAPEPGRITAVKKAGAMAGKLRRVLRQETPAR